MIIVNSLGRLCPLPIIDLAGATKDALPGSIYRLESDDPATWADLKAWARMKSHSVTRISDTSFEITL